MSWIKSPSGRTSPYGRACPNCLTSSPRTKDAVGPPDSGPPRGRRLGRRSVQQASRRRQWSRVTCPCQFRLRGEQNTSMKTSGAKTPLRQLTDSDVNRAYKELTEERTDDWRAEVVDPPSYSTLDETTCIIYRLYDAKTGTYDKTQFFATTSRDSQSTWLSPLSPSSLSSPFSRRNSGRLSWAYRLPPIASPLLTGVPSRYELLGARLESISSVSSRVEYGSGSTTSAR